MSIVVLKLFETFVRSLFVLVASYALPLDESGRFGLFVTLVGLFAFLFAYERQVDMQRKMVGQPPREFDRMLQDGLWFWLFNYAFEVPIFVLLMLLWLKLPLILVLWSPAIVIGEHLANQAYQIAMIGPRYRHLMLVVTAKNAALLAAAGYYIFLDKADLSLASLLDAWGMLSLFSILALGAALFAIKEHIVRDEPLGFPVIARQYRASFNHFMIGLVAILSVQMDRLVAGAFLAPAEIGIYFRNAMPVSIVYQLFNIASFNRVLPEIFAAARTSPVAAIRPRVFREFLTVAGAAALIYAAILAAAHLPHLDGLFAKYHIRPELLCFLFASFLLRAGGDLNGILLNGKNLERRILAIQVSALLVGVVFYVGLSWRFGLMGTVVAGMFGQGLYLFRTRRALSRIEGGETA